MKKGSITVEAACLFPLIFIIILYLMELTLYMHDQVMIAGVMDDAMIKESMAIKQPSNYVTGDIRYEELTKRSLLYTVAGSYETEEESLRRYIKERIEETCIISSLETISVSTKSGTCEVSVVASTNFSVIPIFSFFQGKKMICQSGVITLHNPSDFARRWDNMLKVTGQIEGFGDWGKKQ